MMFWVLINYWTELKPNKEYAVRTSHAGLKALTGVFGLRISDVGLSV